MNSLIAGLRDIVGTPQFASGESLDYNGLLEYFFACIILCIVVSSIFKFIRVLVSR